jgi:hypothetical protein
MSDRFALGVWRQEPGQKGLDIEPSITISADEFQGYIDAISTYRSLSERNTYQILNRNHLRLAGMLKMYTNLERVGGSFRKINQRNVALLFMGEMTNWLASTRLYLESARDFLLNQFGKNSDELRRYRRATSQAFDSYPGYRFLYNLRDYAQHCGPPVSGMTVSSDPTGKRVIEMYLSRSELLVARFDWSRHSKELLARWPEKISVMPLIEESMAGFRTIEDELLRILIQRCAKATTAMREGMGRVAAIEGHPAVFRLPTSSEEDQEDNLAWQSFPEPSGLDAIERAIANDDPLAVLPRVEAPQGVFSPEQTYANSRAAAVIATALEAGGGGSRFNEVVNRVIREDQDITPLISGLTNLSMGLVEMLSQALGSPPQDFLGSLGYEDSDERSV